MTEPSWHPFIAMATFTLALIAIVLHATVIACLAVIVAFVEALVAGAEIGARKARANRQ